jgi:transglutaminase-like putative cysteine protease
MMLAPTPNLTGVVIGIPNGRAGVVATVNKMRELVNQGKVDPQIRQAAQSIIFLQPEKDYYAEAEALFNFVRDTIRYTRDVHMVETLQTPAITLATRMGDCDDQSTLLAAMLESVGIPTRFVVAGYSGNDFEHVYLQAWCNHWIGMDATEPNEMGWEGENPKIIGYEDGFGGIASG